MQQNYLRKSKIGDILWKAFHQFMLTKGLPDDFMISLWNAHNRGETLLECYDIDKQLSLNADRLLNLYYEALVLGLKNLDRKTVKTNYINFLTRYEKLRSIQPIDEFVPAPSWHSRIR